MSIHILADQTIAQIAAGEVVERPASVVKELLENAIDAGASNIHIVINGGGRKLIRISDNGIGILAGEVQLAFTRHATSKLQTVNDLTSIATLGFRGEALSSIAAVSRTTVTTRHRDESSGTQIQMEGGNVVEQQAIGAPAGTVINVENLFYNTPARLKFLKKETTEKRHITSLVTRYAMAYPDVRFVLEQDGREIFRSGGSGQLADVVAKAFGIDNFRQMVEVDSEDAAREGRPEIKVYGYTSTPDYSRADRSHISLFVNGRYIQDSKLTYAIVQAYHTLLMTKRFPVAVLMIEIAPDEVDVNVHPTKAEVRFRNSNAVFSSVQRAVREAVVVFSKTPSVRDGRFSTTQQPKSWGNRAQVKQDSLDLPLEDAGQYPQQDNDADYDLSNIPEGPGRPLKPRTLPLLRVIGQVGAMYIIAEGPAGMYLIDQHAAHERILYEQFMEAHENKELVVQHTLATQTVELSPTEARLLEENLEPLKIVGFELEMFGPNTFAIRSVPGMLADNDPVKIIAGVIDDLEQEKKPGKDAIEEKIIIRICKGAAVKAGQILSREEMRDLIQQLERCQSPHTCPHGRPTMIHMSGDQLAREFGRA
jgi:DNA mismatch repair protein MutL